MDPMTLESGDWTESLMRRFPPVQPTPVHSIRSLSNPVSNVAPYQIPLPFPVFDDVTLNRIWSAPPVYISGEEIADIKDEEEFLGTRWRVVTQDLGILYLDRIRCGTRVVFKGVDIPDVSYFVIGYRLVRGSVSYVDVFAYKRGAAKPISNSVMWPPFTMCVPTLTLHHTMKLSARSEAWVKNVNSRATDEEVGRRLVSPTTGTSSFGYIGSFWSGFFGNLNSYLCAC